MREFHILNKKNVDWLFLDQHARSQQYISYRHFIEQVLFRFLKSYRSLLKESCIEECKKAFKNFLAAYQLNQDYPGSSEQSLELQLRLYWFKGDGKHAALVDDTKHCFPLVMDSDVRSAGLFCAIRNINNRLDDIVRILNQHLDNEWDVELQREMDQFDDRFSQQEAA